MRAPKHTIAQFIGLCVLALLLTGCGFQLRGDHKLSAHLTPLYIQTNHPYSDFTKTLQNTLRTSNIQLVTDPMDASVILNILSETSTQTTGNVATNTTTWVYNLTYKVTYELIDKKGKIITGPFTAIEQRTFMTTSNEILSSSYAQRSLDQDMESAAVSQIIEVLNSTNVNMALDKHFAQGASHASSSTKH